MGTAFDDKTNLDIVAKRLGEIYSKIEFANGPIFKWFNILDDATILGEEVRRNRLRRGAERACKILMRLLEFLGHFLYNYQLATHAAHKDSFGYFFAETLQAESYKNFYANSGPNEGPTRWIYAKYPDACAKCGKKPCVCVVTPWIFEERREKPNAFETYRTETDEKRKELEQNPGIIELNLETYLDFFKDIYRNAYYNQDPWKVVMHLTEELGEATTEFSRLELVHLLKQQNHPLPLEAIRYVSTNKVNKSIESIDASDPLLEKIKTNATNNLSGLLEKISAANAYDYLSKEVVVVQFKEEIADVFSWLAAAIHVLSEGKPDKYLSKIIEAYATTGGMGASICPHCYEKECYTDCVVTHAIAGELVEKAFHL